MSILPRFSYALGPIKAILNAAYWPCLALVLLGIAWYNLEQRRGLGDKITFERLERAEEIRNLRSAYGDLQKLVGRKLAWPESLGVQRHRTADLDPDYQIIALLSGTECSSPRNEISELLKQIVSFSGSTNGPSTRLRVVIGTTEPQTARGYQVANSFLTSVVADPSGQFAKANEIPVEPAVIVADNLDRVVMAATPVGSAAALWPGFKVGLLNLMATRRQTR
jgi:hypothetical protein